MKYIFALFYQLGRFVSSYIKGIIKAKKDWAEYDKWLDSVVAEEKKEV